MAQCLQFKYRNWRGDKHTYLVLPEPLLTFAKHGDGSGEGLNDDPTWQLHGLVVERDGEPHPGAEAGFYLRRSFKVGDLRKLRVVERPDINEVEVMDDYIKAPPAPMSGKGQMVLEALGSNLVRDVIAVKTDLPPDDVTVALDGLLEEQRDRA
jgi:hypothetical protein